MHSSVTPKPSFRASLCKSTPTSNVSTPRATAASDPGSTERPRRPIDDLMGGRLAVGLLVIVLLAVLIGFGALRRNVAFFASKGRLEPAAERHYRESIRRDFDTLEPLD